jgi:hypothetical protein
MPLAEIDYVSSDFSSVCLGYFQMCSQPYLLHGRWGFVYFHFVHGTVWDMKLERWLYAFILSWLFNCFAKFRTI